MCTHDGAHSGAGVHARARRGHVQTTTEPQAALETGMPRSGTLFDKFLKVYDHCHQDFRLRSSRSKILFCARGVLCKFSRSHMSSAARPVMAPNPAPNPAPNLAPNLLPACSQPITLTHLADQNKSSQPGKRAPEQERQERQERQELPTSNTAEDVWGRHGLGPGGCVGAHGAIFCACDRLLRPGA